MKNMDDNKALLDRAKELDARATPGPWMWDMRTAHRMCQLVTAHSGQYYVMQFSRWGMQDACPEFQRFKRYSGPVNERGSLGMIRADKMAKSYPGREHHKGFDDYIDHPDAVFIAESRQLVTDLIAALEAQAAQLAAVTAERHAATEANEPLTLEELREMDGDPVWVVNDEEAVRTTPGFEPLVLCALVEVCEESIFLTNNLGGRTEYAADVELEDDGVGVYRRPPERGDG